ncbi:hypothetical protein BDQ17DRAFT_1384599 [Cyathus striatus]|nr:hypothetical protein BDQ17DRAFT_1384599 [Cyathus striatus]
MQAQPTEIKRALPRIQTTYNTVEEKWGAIPGANHIVVTSGIFYVLAEARSKES